MKKARNLWRDLPQGGSRYGSVLTRLFLLLCLLATTQAGWAAETLTLSKSSSDWTSGSSVNATVGSISISSGNNAKTSSHKWGGSSNTNNVYIQISSNPLYISSTSANIKKIEFTGWANSSSASNACDVKSCATQDGTYAVVSSGFSATRDGSSLASLTNINMAGYDAAGTTVVVTFDTPLQYIQIAKNSKETWIGSIKVYTEDSGGGSDTTPPTLSSANPGNGATDVATSGNITLTFSENVTIKDASKFTLTTTGAGSLTTANISASGAVVTIPYTGFDNSTSYTLNTAAGAVEDAANNENAALSGITFTTVAAAIEPTATFNNGSYTIGGSALDLSTLWTSNSSGAVTYTVTNANGTGATISGSNFTATTAGTATVKATQAAVSGSYSSIEKTATITVNASGSSTNYYILSALCNVPLTAGMNNAKYQVLKSDGSTVTATTDISSSLTTAANYYYNSTSPAYADLTNTSNYASGSSSNRTMQAIKLTSGNTMTIDIGSKTFSKMDVIYRCASTDAKSITIDGTAYDTSDKNAHLATITKTFNSDITISNSSGKEYDVLVILTESSATTYNINCATGLTNGSISAPASAAAGATVTVTANPDNGYKLNTVTVTKNGDTTTTPVSGTGNSRSFTMPAYAVDVTATFVALPKIKITAPSNGTVTTSPASYAEEGATVTITATPASGYALNAITVTDGNSQAVTVTNNQFTMPNDTVTVTATFVAQQVSAGDRWNFTTMNSSDMALYDASSDWNSTTSNSKPIYGNAFTASKGSYASYSTTNIEQIYGMQFGRMSGGSLQDNAVKVFKPTTTGGTDGYLQLDNSSISVQLPLLEANTELTVYYSGSSTKGFELENATVKGSSGVTKIIGENANATIVVTDGSKNVTLTTESSGFKIYRIVVGTAVTVSAPTITNPADGTEYDGTTALSPTVTTTQAEDGGTVTTYWAYSTAAMTRAQIVAANNGFTTNTATATITAADVNERTMVLNAVTKYEKGSSTYYSDIVTATYPYTGVKSSNLTVDHLDIQYGEERTLKPVFKYNDGTEFDPSGDDIHSSINDYFDFTFTKNSVTPTDQDSYISVDGNGVVKTKDASGTKATVGTEAVFTVTATKKSGWNESTDGKWPFNQTSYTFNQATIKVVAKETGFHMTFYWDPEYKQQVDPSEYNLGTGDESSVTIFSEKMYNGRMIYAKPDDGYTIYVAAGINSGSVSNVSSNSKKNGVNYYKYTYNDPTDEYPDAPIEFNGMPILIEDDNEWGGANEKFFYLNVHTYNNSTKTFEGSPIKAKFTVLNNDSRRPSASAPIRLEPSTATNPLSTAQTVAVVGAEGAYVYGKFSSSSTYTTPNLINEKGVLGGVSSVAVFSTEVNKRKISATQVLKNADGYYYIGGQVNLTYTYRFATELNLTKNSHYTNVVKSGDDAQTINLDDLIQSITYYNKDEKKDIDITNTESNNGETTATQKETVTYEVEYRNGAGGEGGTTVENGIVTIGAHSGQVIITFTYPGGTYKKTVNKKEGYTAEATETFTIYLTDPSEQIPNITPTTRNFTDEQAVRVQAPKDWNTLYMIQEPTYESTDTEHKNPIYDNVTYISSGEQKNCFLLEKGEFVMLTLTESARVRAFAYDQNEFTENHEPTSTGTNTSKEVYETYTKLDPLQAPVLSPSGNPHVRTTKDLTVNVTLKDAISGLEVYYTTDGTDPTPTTGELFNGSEKIKISGASTTVKAIAYEPSTGRISPIASGVYVYTGNITQPKFYVSDDDGSTWDEGHIEGTVVVGPNDRVKIEGPGGSTLYYTLDGSTPTPGASREFDVSDESAPFLIMKNTTGRALAILDDASSPVTTVEFVLESDLENLWEAVEETTPGGKMANDDRYVVYGKQTGNSSTTAVKYLTATFGGMDNAGWSHADISESTKGTPLDGIGNYSIRNVIDAWDESGKEPQNTSTLALHDRTFKLPAQGDMVRFEPERDGQLTIWLLQQGGLNYTDDGEFCDAFMRLRPVYLFDEQGNSIPVSSNRGIKSSTRLSSNWDKLQGVGKWTPKDEKQLGVTNIYYTTEESNKIYAMYNNYLDGKGAGDAIEPFEVPDGDVKTMLSNLGLTGYGYVMPSGGYVRYNFDVKGGKSYYLFGFRTKLGVRGFRFQPSNETEAKSVTVADNTDNIVATIKAGGTDGPIAADEICNVTYKRAFTAGKLAGIVLPFSVSRTQLQKVFGESVDVLHFEGIEGSKINFKRHWYPMIVAGTPVLIRPSKTIDKETGAIFEGVRIEAESVTAMENGNYTMTGDFTNGSTIKDGDYYIAGGQLACRSAGPVAMSAGRAWISSPSTGARTDMMMFSADAFGADEWNVAGNPQPFVQKEDVVTYINGVEEDGIIQTNKPANVYTISGQLVRKNSTSLEGLPKGIYIVNGKKVAIK